MKVYLWEPASGDIISSLQDEGDLFEYENVTSKEELFSSIPNEEQVCIVIIDIDSLEQDLFSLDLELQAMATVKKLYSSQEKTAKELKELQDQGLTADAFLKRPHNISILYNALNM